MVDELELGLPPAKPKRVRVARERTEYEWRKDVAKDRPYCAMCLERAEKVNGWPTKAVNRSAFVEHGPDGTIRLCAIHKQEREEKLK